jgi:hypothetical protein
MQVMGTSEQVTATTALTLTVHPTLTLSVSPVLRTILPGETASYTVGVAASESFGAPVALSLDGIPSQAVGHLTPNPIVPPGSSQLLVETVTSTAASSYSLTVTGRAGPITDSFSLALVVEPPAPSYGLEVFPTTHVAWPGQAVRYQVSVTEVEGDGHAMGLTVVGVPTGVNARWADNPIAPGSSTTLTLALSSAAPLGDHLLSIVGTAPTQVVTQSVTLRIELPPIYLPLMVG